VVLNDSRNTSQGPEIIAETVGTRALAEEVEQAVALLGGESGLTARMTFGVKASVPMLVTGIAPATDGTG